MAGRRRARVDAGHGRHRRRAVAAGLALAAALVFMAGPLRDAVEVAGAYVWPSRLAIVVEPGDVRVRAGRAVTIRARLSGNAALAPMFVAGTGGQERDVQAEEVGPVREAGKGRGEGKKGVGAARKLREAPGQPSVERGDALEGSDADGGLERRVGEGVGPYVGARTELLLAIATSRCCELVWRNDRLGRVVTVYGHRSDLVDVETTFLALDHQARVGMATATTTGNTLQFRRSWLLGFAREIRDRLAASDAEVALSYRQPEFGKAREANKRRFKELVDQGRVFAFMASNIKEVKPESVTLDKGGKMLELPNDLSLIHI